MLTFPTKSRRKKQPYLAIRSRLMKRQLETQIELFLPEIIAFMTERELGEPGLPFLRFLMTNDSGEMEAEFGFFTNRLHEGQGPVRSGIMPAGQFYSVSWHGDSAKVFDVEQVLMGWGHITNIEWDSTPTAAGVFYGCRLYVFHKHRGHSPDPKRWMTEVTIMARDRRTK